VVSSRGYVLSRMGSGFGESDDCRNPHPQRFLDNFIAKGSVAVDGVSLTLTEILQDRFSVALVPSTMKAGSLGEIETGDRVNLEYDMIGKLAARYENQAAAALSAVLGNMPWSGSRE